MINNKQLLPLSLIAVVAYILAVVLSSQDQGKSNFSQLPILPGLAEVSADITKLTISTSEAKPLIEAAKSELGWVIANKNNFPADTEALSKFVAALKDASKVEAKTKVAKNYPRLGVADIEQPDSQANLVSVTSGEQRWQLLVGNVASQGRYVRLQGAEQSWLIDQNISLPIAAADWLKQTIIDLPEENIKQLQLSQTSGDVLVTALKQEQQQKDFSYQDLPEGKKLKYDVILNPLARNFSSLKLTDVKPADPDWWQSLQASHQVKVSTFDAAEIIAEFRLNGEEDFWLRLSSSDVNQSGFWSSWLFQVDGFTAKQFLKTADDYLDDIAPEQTDE